MAADVTVDTDNSYDLGSTDLRFTEAHFSLWKSKTQQQIINTSNIATTLLIKNSAAGQNIQHHMEIEGSITMTQATGVVPAPDLVLTYSRSGGAGDKHFTWDETNDIFVFDDDLEVDSEITFNSSSHRGLMVQTGAAAFTAASATSAGLFFTSTSNGRYEFRHVGGGSVFVIGAANTGTAERNFGFNGTSWGGGEYVLFISNAKTNPSSNPTGGGILYVDAGALKYRGSSGTTTTIAVA